MNDTMQPEDWRRIQYFTPNEFKEPRMMAVTFVVWLDNVRALAKVPMRITSSYRTSEHNAEVGGASHSAHTDIPCRAVDIVTTPTPFDPHGNQARWKIVTAAIKLGCTRIGIYKDGSIHLDMSNRVNGVMWVKVDNPA